MTKQAIIRCVSLQRAIVFNMLAPIAVYQVATSRGLPELQGLLLASIFPSAQTAIRDVTLVWGLAFVGEATLRIALSFIVEPAVLVTTSPILAAATFGPLGLWTPAAKSTPPT